MQKRSILEKNIRVSSAYNAWEVIAHDIENRGQPDRAGLLLSAFYKGGDSVLVIDNTSVDNQEVFTPEYLKRCLFIAHNADHEARWGVKTDFVPGRYACTMVNDRRLLSGAEGYRFDLVSVINRRLGYKAIPTWMNKDIRSEFAHCEFFTDEHILYNASDVICLIDVLEEQLTLAETYGQSFLHTTINSRIILPIAEAETTGIKHDSEKWIGIAQDRQQRANEICQTLDQLIETQYGVSPNQINPVLRKQLETRERRVERNQARLEKLTAQKERFEQQGKTHLKSYQTTLQTLDKLLSTMHESVETVSGGINWGSSKQVLEVLQRIGCPLPKAKDDKTRQLKAGVKKEARANWFVINEGSSFTELMTQFDKYKKLIHNVHAFGQKWVDDYVREDGRVYTQLNQAGADTGRLTSGDRGASKKIHFNIQQIPKPAEYRECFVADPGRRIITADYRNCEGVVMIALSGDLDMKKITELDDQHSYLGTKAWRAIYRNRFEKTGDRKWLELAETYTMDQSTSAKIKERDIFKNSGGLFPVVYGVTAPKVAATSKIPEHEGQVMIDAVKLEVPKVIEALDAKSKEASTLGYVVHNKRTGSRRWFTKILDNLHYGFPVGKGDIVEAEMAARNSPIQGTNSDIMKEAIAMVHLYARLFKRDIRFLLTVHDEGAWDVPENEADELAEKIESLMIRAAQSYLIPEIMMKVDVRVADHWKK